MSVLGLLYLFVVALIITLFFGYALSVRGPWGSFWTFFVVILLAVMAADLWMAPIGPYYRDVYWFPPLGVGLLIALLLAATTPSPQTRSKLELQNKEPVEENAVALALGGFFWLLFAFMITVVIFGIFNSVAS
jgi:hypothetical protein